MVGRLPIKQRPVLLRTYRATDDHPAYLLAAYGFGRVAARHPGPARETTLRRGGRVHTVGFRGHRGIQRDHVFPALLRTLLRAAWARKRSGVGRGPLLSGVGRGGGLRRLDQAVRHRLREGPHPALPCTRKREIAQSSDQGISLIPWNRASVSLAQDTRTGGD